jgi:tartrate/fumarate subfamily iron-sulfur-dependent hydro-lyase alpha chain
MITGATIEAAMYEAIRLAATCVPPDVERALEDALAEESDPLARMHLEVSGANFRLAAEGKGLVCADTGFPLFFVTAGNHTQIEGGFETLWQAARKATVRATSESILRPTMVDPLTRSNPGNNVGPGMPRVELVFSGNGDALDIVAAPKGGGSEIFGTSYRMLFPSDGRTGILAFVLECIRESCYAGKICPPAIIGVGIGGTADLCMQLAKKAALLRTLGVPSPEPAVAELETRLLAAARDLGIGPMGVRGINAVMGVHIETALTHTAALPIAVNAQCLIGRRWKTSIRADGTTCFSGDI